MEIRFENKVAFITGAAGGIGYAAARMFAEAGASVVMVDLNGQITDRAKELEAEGHDAIGRGASESGGRKGGRCFRQVGYSL